MKTDTNLSLTALRYIVAVDTHRNFVSMKTDTNLSLTALRYIVAVDTHRNFVRAAEACGITQPTLSAGIRSIETALDVTIFDRGAHPVRPTALGEKIIAPSGPPPSERRSSPRPG